MTELMALLSEISVVTAGNHIHIVTDQQNLEINFPPEFQIQSPNTFYKIANSTVFNDLPSLAANRLRASAILSMIVILVLSPRLEGSKNLEFPQSEKLLHAVNSARDLIRMKLDDDPTYFKGPFIIFWLTSHIPESGKKFPTHIFYTRKIKIDTINIHMPNKGRQRHTTIKTIQTTLFIVELKKIQDCNAYSSITFVCPHCSVVTVLYFVTFIPVGIIKFGVLGIFWLEGSIRRLSIVKKLIKTMSILAPVKAIMIRHSFNTMPYVTSGCGGDVLKKFPINTDVGETGLFCGSNITIIHYPLFWSQDETILPMIYGDTHSSFRYGNVFYTKPKDDLVS